MTVCQLTLLNPSLLIIAACLYLFFCLSNTFISCSLSLSSGHLHHRSQCTKMSQIIWVKFPQMAQIRLNRMKSSCSSFMSSSAMTRPRGKFNMASGRIAELHTVLSVRDAARLFCVASEKLLVSRDSSCGRPLGWLMQSDTETTLESQKVNSFSPFF